MTMPSSAAATVPTAVTSMISHLRRRSMPDDVHQIDGSVLAEDRSLGGNVAGLRGYVCVRIGSDLLHADKLPDTHGQKIGGVMRL